MPLWAWLLAWATGSVYVAGMTAVWCAVYPGRRSLGAGLLGAWTVASAAAALWPAVAVMVRLLSRPKRRDGDWWDYAEAQFRA